MHGHIAESVRNGITHMVGKAVEQAYSRSDLLTGEARPAHATAGRFSNWMISIDNLEDLICKLSWGTIFGVAGELRGHGLAPCGICIGS